MTEDEIREWDAWLDAAAAANPNPFVRWSGALQPLARQGWSPQEAVFLACAWRSLAVRPALTAENFTKLAGEIEGAVTRMPGGALPPVSDRAAWWAGARRVLTATIGRHWLLLEQGKRFQQGFVETQPRRSLKLDDMTLLAIHEGRKEGKKSPSVWLPFDVWLGVVTRLLPDEQIEKMTDETLPFWEGLWNRNLSPIEAIMNTAMETTLSEVLAAPRLKRRPPPGQRVAPEGRRYLMFAGSFQSAGGWKDYKGAYNTLQLPAEEANFAVAARPDAWAHVVDLQAEGGPRIVVDRSGSGGVRPLRGDGG